jgi:hypothetical protein
VDNFKNNVCKLQYIVLVNNHDHNILCKMQAPSALPPAMSTDGSQGKWEHAKKGRSGP